MPESQTPRDNRAVGTFTLSTPWYHGWNIIAVTILFQAFTLGLMVYSFSFWILPLQEEFGVGASAVLLAATLANIGVGVYSPFAGRFMDAISIRMLTMCGIVCFALGYLLISLTNALWQILFIYATLLPIGGILAGTLSAQVATTRWFEKRRGAALGLSSLGTSIGGFVLPPIVTALIGTYGWRTSHVILAVAMVVIVIPVIWLIVRNRHEADIEPGQNDAPKSASESSDPKWTTVQILKTKTFWILVCSLIPLMLVFVSVQYNIAPITSNLDIPPQQAAFLMSSIAISMVFGKLMFGAMADRVDHRIALWIAFGIMLGCVVSLRWAESYWPLMISLALMGFAAGGILPMMGAIVASHYGPTNFGQVAGLLTPSFTITSLGPVVFGILKAQLGSYDTAFLILTFVLLPSIAIIYFLDPPNDTS